MQDNLIKKYIPMTETTYYTLLAVMEPRHGYAKMCIRDSLKIRTYRSLWAETAPLTPRSQTAVWL